MVGVAEVVKHGGLGCDQLSGVTIGWEGFGLFR